MIFLSFFEHSRSPRPSILLNGFLFLTLLFDIAQTRSLWLVSQKTSDEFTFAIVFTVSTAWKAILILFESKHKQRWLHWDKKDHSPEETSGLYGLGTFFWLNSLFWSGYKKALTVPDLFALDKNMSAEFLQTSFPSKFENLVNFPRGQKNGLARSLARSLAIPLLLPVIPRVALMGFSFCQPFLIKALLDYLQDSMTSSPPPNNGYGLIGATALVYTGIPFATAFYWYFQERALCMSRAYLATAVYRKTTEAKASAADDDNAAAVTLMSSDVERIRFGFMQLHEFWANPIQAAILCWLLQRQLGAAFAAPLVVIVFCVCCSALTMRLVGPRQMAWMKVIQKRVGHTANTISHIKPLKFSGLAGPVEEAIQALRDDELKIGNKFRAVLVGSVGIGFTPILLGPVFTLAVTSRTLDVTTIFTSVSYLLLLSEPLNLLFQIVPHVLTGMACLQRVQAFLEKESRHDFRDSMGHSLVKMEEQPDNPVSGTPAIKIMDGSFGWAEDKMILKNITATIPRGPSLTMVVGPTGSGKSTLCKALLGETPITKGNVFMGTRFQKVGYCDQVPFLLNTTIRDSIIGFSPIDEQRYADVISATLLTQDLLELPQGDYTKIGSGGFSLSGGQKQRVAIARALYLPGCDLLIFDDVLSGLDASTQEKVFNRIFGPLGMLQKRSATAILCTHSVRYLPSADYIIALGADGTLVEEGVFEDLVANKQYIHSLGVQIGASDQDSIINPKDTKTTSTEGGSAETAKIAPEDTQRTSSNTPVPPTIKEEKKDPTPRRTGDRAILLHYFKSIGPFWLSNFVIFGLLFGFFNSFSTVWLKFWSEDSDMRKHSTPFYIGIYAMIQSLALSTLLLEAVVGMLVIIRLSGAALHKTALRTVMAAPLYFFAETDTGVVTNLFSQDMTLIDGELPQALINTSLYVWMAVGLAGVIASSSPYIIIAYPFIVAVLYTVQRFYLRTSRQLRLLDLEAKSPL